MMVDLIWVFLFSVFQQYFVERGNLEIRNSIARNQIGYTLAADSTSAEILTEDLCKVLLIFCSEEIQSQKACCSYI